MSGDPVQVTRTMCPPLTPYALELQLKAAREINSLGPEAALPKFMNDYGKLRDACRVIQKRNSK